MRGTTPSPANHLEVVNGQKEEYDANEPIELPVHLTQALENLSRSEGATLFMAMLAVFKVLLARYYYYVRQEDIVVAAELLDVRVQMVHERAFLAYRPLPYHGKVALFRTLDQDSAYEYDHDLGWSAVVQGGVEVHCVPGIHTTIFSDENAPNLARKVEECIRSALVKSK